MSDVIQNTRAVCERNRRDYEELAKMTGQTIAEIEADTTAPDPRCICPDCAGTGTQVVSTGIMPEHGNLEQESCDRCGGTGTIAQGGGVITDEDARKLAIRIRRCSKNNEASASTQHNKGHRQWLEGRADAYRLAANWLMRLILDKEADGEQRT